jgi:hypothetical protein
MSRISSLNHPTAGALGSSPEEEVRAAPELAQMEMTISQMSCTFGVADKLPLYQWFHRVFALQVGRSIEPGYTLG